MQNGALGELLETVGHALVRYADQVRAGEEKAITAIADSLDEVSLGSRQREVVDILRGAGEGGSKTSEVSDAINYDQANTHMTLRALQARGIVEEVPGVRPTRWRLAAPYRANADPYLEVAALIRPGEWTTYGDISIAVRGDTRAARAVGRAAATLAHFPNPHRVLKEGGVIPPAWHPTDDPTPNPEECRRRLQDEGVRFDRSTSRAKREHYVSWDELVTRGESAEAA